MLQKIYILFFMLCISGVCFAQKSYRDYIRSGNKLYNDSVFVKAEVDYRKALEKNPQSTDAMFNLANSLLMQQKAKEAMEMYQSTAKIEKDKGKLAQIYHNMGVILQTSKKYPECIEMYKESLKRNPKDNETRYNLALAQKMLKDQQQQQNKDKNQNQNNNNKQQQNKSQMSKENAEQLLNAVTQDEKDIQDKVKKQIQIQGKKLDKDW